MNKNKTKAITAKNVVLPVISFVAVIIMLTALITFAVWQKPDNVVALASPRIDGTYHTATLADSEYLDITVSVTNEYADGTTFDWKVELTKPDGTTVDVPNPTEDMQPDYDQTYVGENGEKTSAYRVHFVGTDKAGDYVLVFTVVAKNPSYKDSQPATTTVTLTVTNQSTPDLGVGITDPQPIV
jgi:hypothetical protein